VATQLSHRNPVGRERDLAEVRLLLANVEDQCAQRELDLTTLRLELESFRIQYWKIVAPLYAKLDEIDAEIRAYEASREPDNEEVRKSAQESERRAKESRREADLSDEEPDTPIFEASDELRKAYRRAAKAVHPDRASDDADRDIRNAIMAQINKAYERGDLDEIERLVEEYRAGCAPERVLTLEEELEFLERQITRVKQRLVDIEKEIVSLTDTDLARLMRDAERGRAKGRNVLKELAEDLQSRISDSLRRLEAVRKEFNRGASEIVVNSDDPDISSAPTDSPVESESAKDEDISSEVDETPFDTARGDRVRSNSEVVIANLLHELGVDYVYEYPVEGTTKPGIRRPNFAVKTSEGKFVLWLHIRPSSDVAQNEKLDWYESNGFIPDVSLFVTHDDMSGKLDLEQVKRVAEKLLLCTVS
jgi:hypothetical protein